MNLTALSGMATQSTLVSNKKPAEQTPSKLSFHQVGNLAALESLFASEPTNDRPTIPQESFDLVPDNPAVVTIDGTEVAIESIQRIPLLERKKGAVMCETCENVDADANLRYDMKLDENKHATYRMYLTNPYVLNVAPLLAILLSAKEGDTIYMTISGGWAWGSNNADPVINAINQCKAKVITRASFLVSIPQILVFLAGHECQISSYSSAMLWLGVVFAFGTAVDSYNAVDFQAKHECAMVDTLVELEFLTAEEAESLYKDQKITTFVGNELKERVDRVIAHKAKKD